MRRISLRLFALPIVFTAVAAPLQPSLADGAYAIGQGPNGSWAGGSAYNQPSVEDAVAVAMEYCRNNDYGITQCKVISTFSNTCFALAVQSDGNGNAYGWATNDNIKAARRAAVTRCYERTDSCSVRKSFCDEGGN
jgi:hypothetical protein